MNEEKLQEAIELLEKANGLVYNGQHPMPKAEITSLISKALALLKSSDKKTFRSARAIFKEYTPNSVDNSRPDCKPEPQDELDELKDWDIETELFECCKICPECSFKLQGFKDYACDRLAQAGADRKALQAALVDMQQLTEKLTNDLALLHESDIKVAQEYEQLQQQLAEAKKEAAIFKELANR